MPAITLELPAFLDRWFSEHALFWGPFVIQRKSVAEQMRFDATVMTNIVVFYENKVNK